MAIKNIIFDLGGVFIDIFFQKTKQAFEDLGVEDYDDLFGQHHASDLFVELETGKISSEDFYTALRQLVKLPVTDGEIRDAWNALLGDYHLANLAFLDSLKEKYRLFLFSNTNQIHYNVFAPQCEDIAGRTLESYFEKAYFSHNLGLRKPSEESFNAILEEQNLRAKETLFIDDTIGNILGAQAVGLQTFLLTNIQTLPNLNL